jgi:hypothetical protein
MLKYLFIILNSLAIFLYSMLRDDLDIITGFPNKVRAGETFNAEVTIFKGSLRKFGKLELILPPGFSVEVTDPKAADFTFVGNKATFLWSYLPAEEEFTVSFKVTTSNAVSGRKIIKSNFYYVENNLKEVLEIDPVEIKVKNDGGVPEDNDEAPITKKKANTVADTVAKVVTDTAQSIANTTTENNSNTTQPAETINNASNAIAPQNNSVTAKREITEGSTKGEYKVTHTINKGDLTGFGKIEDKIPEGYAAANDNAGSASYTFTNNKVRYVWVNLPKDNTINVSYLVRKTGSATNHIIAGNFDYLKNNETQSIAIGESLIPASTETTLAANDSKVEPIVKKEKAKPTEGALTGYKPNAKKTRAVAKNPPTLNTQALDNTVPESATTDEFSNTKSAAPVDSTSVVKSGEASTPVNTTANSNNATNTGQEQKQKVPSSNAKVNFSVQVAALQKQKEAANIQRFLALSDKLQIEFHDGYSKYVSGKFDEYLKAKTHRDKIRNNGKRRAFVTAYNTGKRITVQEALMIANQQWYK